MLPKMRALKVLGAILVAAAGWALFVEYSTEHAWWHGAPAPKGDRGAFMRGVTESLKGHVGNVSLVLLENSQPIDEYYASTGKVVGRDTAFQVGSVSKWITAYGVMTLVERGLIDLDAPVSRYLTRWQLPPSAFDHAGVTVRRLLSHTAGLTDGLGFDSYGPGDTLQSLEAELAHPRAAPGHEIRVGVAPGSEWRYSGGGYLLLQLIVEEVAKQPFDAYMQRAVLEPLGMRGSTFAEEPNLPDVAESFDTSGTPAPFFRHRAVAAKGLYTTAGDIVRFLHAHASGERREGLARPTAMRVPSAWLLGQPVWGLGVALVAKAGSDWVIGHGGVAEPAINAELRFDPTTGDGIVVLLTGNRNLATRLAERWVHWRMGKLGLFTMLGLGQAMATAIGLGWLAIVVTRVLLWRRGRIQDVYRNAGSCSSNRWP